MLKKLSILVAVTITMLALSVCVSAAPVTAPGGEVGSYAELITALGGDKHVSLKTLPDGKTECVVIYDDIELSSPVRITSGSYVIYGAGATVTCSFESGSFFEVTGKDTSLIIGNPEGSKSTDTVFNGKNESRSGSFVLVGEGASLAVYPGTVMKDTVTTASGGAIHNEGSLVVYGGEFSGCRAVTSGGAFYNDGDMVLSSGKVMSCSSGLGGGLYNNKKATLIGISFSECVSDKGGAVYNCAEMKFASSSVTSSKAGQGAGVYNSGECEFLGGSITGCVAENGDGGAVYNCGTLTLTAGYLDGNSARYGGNVYNEAEMTTENNATLSGGKAETGGNIYNAVNGHTVFNGGSISLGKATYGGGVFNVGSIDLQGSNIMSNKADVGGGFFNGGRVVMTKNGYVDPTNDFFVLLSEDNSHALHIGEGWVYDRQIIKLSCGVAVDDGYVYKESVGDVLIVTDNEYYVGERFETYHKNGLAISDDGTLVKAAPDLSLLWYILGGIVAFAAVVTAIVIPVRYFDKKKTSTVSADDYF